MTAVRLATRVARLERQQHAREPGGLDWLALPDDEITYEVLQRATYRLTHEEALAQLDAEPVAEGDDEGGAA